MILSFTFFLFLNRYPKNGISPKIGIFELIVSVLFLISPPSIIDSPFNTIAVVLISFFEVSGLSPAFITSFASSIIASISRVTLFSLEILGFTFKESPISSLLLLVVVPLDPVVDPVLKEIVSPT